MKLGAAVLFNLFFFVQNTCVSAQEWKKIVPLKTTRTDVEAILGPASGGFEVLYRLKDGNLSIEYSTGPCRDRQAGGWNVPENVVVSIHFSPLRKKKLSDLKLDLRKLRKVVDDHLPGFVYYINDEDGITYASQQGRLDYIEYGPSKKYDHLYCKGPG